MARFIVRYRGPGPRPSDAVARVSALPGARVIEDAGRTLLVEGDEAELRSTLADESLWIVAPETTYPSPDPRRRVKRTGFSGGSIS